MKIVKWTFAQEQWKRDWTGRTVVWHFSLSLECQPRCADQHMQLPIFQKQTYVAPDSYSRKLGFLRQRGEVLRGIDGFQVCFL